MQRETFRERADSVRRGAVAGAYNDMLSQLESGAADRKPEDKPGAAGGGRVHGKAFADAFKAHEGGESKGKGGKDKLAEMRARQSGGVKGTADALRLASLNDSPPK